MKPIHHQEKIVYPIVYPTQFGGMTSVNCYLYQTSNKLYLIDAGLSSNDFLEFFYDQLHQYQLAITDIDAILLTHHHGDHIGVVNEVLRHKNVPVYAHELSLERLYVTEPYIHNKITFFETIYEQYGCAEFGKERIHTIRQNFETNATLKLTTPVHTLQDGQMLDDLKIIHTPGHSLDSILFYDKKAKWLFAGDTLLYRRNTSALIDFDDDLSLLPTVQQYKNSLSVCSNLEIDFIFSGHEQIMSDAQETIERNINRIDFQLHRFLDCIANGHDTVLKIGNFLYKERFQKLFLFIFSEIVGYTNYAIQLGLLEKYMKDGYWHFRLLK